MPVLENVKHEAFAEAVAEGASATRAYRDNVAEKDSLTGTCMVNASKLMSEAKVAQRVAELRKDFAEVLEAKLGVRRETVARLLLEIIETPICEVKESHPLCQEYSETPGMNGTSYRYKMPSKADAAKELCKLAGWYAPEKIEHSGGLNGMFADVTGAKEQ